MSVGMDQIHIGPGVDLSEARIALIAGAGKIPSIVADHIQQVGHAPFLVLLKGSASDDLRQYDHCELPTAAIGKLISTLKRKNITHVVIVGGVSGRPTWNEYRPDLTTLRLVSKIIAGIRSGDSALLSGVVEVLEEAGIAVVGAHEVMPDLLAPLGKISGKKPTQLQHVSIDLGVRAAQTLGSLDAGQGCVVIGSRIVALEGVEGTDAMLSRVAELRRDGRLPSKRGGVLVKMCKPQQDRRVDMPTIGLSTVKNAVKADLDGIAVQALGAMIVDFQAVVAEATRTKTFVYGIQPTSEGG